jgi:hypothetical protein
MLIPIVPDKESPVALEYPPPPPPAPITVPVAFAPPPPPAMVSAVKTEQFGKSTVRLIVVVAVLV